jgi:hypothetical protein
MNEVAAIQFRADLNREVTFLDRGEGVGRVRRRKNKVAPIPTKNLHVAAHHRRNRPNGVQPMLPRRLDATCLVQTGQPLLLRAVIDAAGARLPDPFYGVAYSKPQTQGFMAETSRR